MPDRRRRWWRQMARLGPGNYSTENVVIAAGAGRDAVRLSIGIEDVEDIAADLDQAPKAAA